MSPTTTTSRARFMTCSSTRTGNIAAPISPPTTTIWRQHRPTRSCIWRRSCGWRPARSCSTSAAAGAGSPFTSRSSAGVDATGVTLSTEQHKMSNERAAAAGLGDRVRFHLRDYREQPGPFDRIVSVGMFEHVGAAHYREFFRKVKDLLTDDGVMLLHSIGRMEPPGGDQPVAAQVHLPRRLYAGAVGSAARGRGSRPLGHRHRDPAPALRLDVARMAPPLRRQSPEDRRRSTTNASAACGNSISPAARSRSAT